MARRAVDNSLLERWRQLDAARLLALISDHAKADASFRPTKDSTTTRWHACVAGTDFEFLCTGPKFYDTRAHLGGSGAVDLVMHALKLDFKKATAFLCERGL